MPSSYITESTIDDARDSSSITRIYLVDLGQDVTNEYTALVLARSIGPHPVPVVRTILTGTALWCDSVRGARTKERRDHWLFTATFTTLPKGESSAQQEENPLLRPPIFALRYVETEEVVKEAYNVEELGVQFAAGAPYRAANTLGPIVNGAGIRPDEPIMRTRRRTVFVIQKNYASLGAIMAKNEAFEDSTNSDSITVGSHTFTARRLKYECTTEGGRQELNGVTFYPGETEISVHRSTDLKFDNVGYDYYTDLGKLVRALDEDGEQLAEPVNLTRDGRKAADGAPIQNTFRDLRPVAYSSLFS